MIDDDNDPNSFRKINEMLVERILKVLQSPGELDTSNPEKEARDSALLRDYYRLTGQKVADKTPRARSVAEMMFAASLSACPHCKTTERPQFALYGSGDRWSVAGPCPQCRQTRSFECDTQGDPQATPAPRHHLGDTRASRIIRPGQFIAELDRLLPKIQDAPTKLAAAEWTAPRRDVERAVICLNELVKFIPAGMKIMSDLKLDEAERRDQKARPERYRRAWLTAELVRLLEIVEAFDCDAPRIEREHRDRGA